MTITQEQLAEAQETKEKLGRWISRNHELNDRMKVLIYTKWCEGKKVKESDLDKTKWGKEFLAKIPCSLPEYLRCSIYFD